MSNSNDKRMWTGPMAYSTNLTYGTSTVTTYGNNVIGSNQITVLPPQDVAGWVALALRLGCPVEKLDELYTYLQMVASPSLPSAALEQMALAIEAVVARG